MAAQNKLGRPFSLPPSPADMVYLVTFMLGKNLEPSTIRSYLSAVRFFLLSKGVHAPPKLPPLAEQLIQGRERIKRNPGLEAEKKTRRAITLHMLKLLENAIASRKEWTTFEKSLRWSTVLLVQWSLFPFFR